jgi:hypothetical protein
MNKLHFTLFSGLIALAAAFCLLGPQPLPGGVSAAESSASEAALREESTAASQEASPVIRGMVRFLEAAPPATLRKLAGQGAAQGTESAPAGDATETGLGKVEETERKIAAHYPATATGQLIRRYVALSLSEVDTDFRPDLSRNRAMNDLMQDAAGAASELRAALGNLAPDDLATESERRALLTLAAHVGSNEAALPAVEGILTSEISRRAGLDLNANEARLIQLIDSYTMLVSDPRKQVEFVRMGIQSQDDTRLRQTLENCLSGLVGAGGAAASDQAG